jgi:hypothetical protein
VGSAHPTYILLRVSNMSNTLKSKISEIINQLELLDPDDPQRMRCLRDRTELLLKDEQETLNLLKNCDRKMIYGVMTALDEVAGQFPSYELLNILESLLKRFPNQEIFILNFKLAIDVVKTELKWLSNEKN